MEAIFSRGDSSISGRQKMKVTSTVEAETSGTKLTELTTARYPEIIILTVRNNCYGAGDLVGECFNLADSSIFLILFIRVSPYLSFIQHAVNICFFSFIWGTRRRSIFTCWELASVTFSKHAYGIQSSVLLVFNKTPNSISNKLFMFVPICSFLCESTLISYGVCWVFYN